MVCPAIFIVLTGFVGCNKVLAVAFLSLGVGSGGIAMAGYNINHLDLASPFAGKVTHRTDCSVAFCSIILYTSIFIY